MRSRLILWTVLLSLPLGAGSLFGFQTQQAEDRGSNAISLPMIGQWKPELADLKTNGETAQLLVPINYKIGRAISPTVPVTPGEVLTFAADVKTTFAGSQQSFYRCWLELEFLKDKQVIETAHSPELIGTTENPQLLAVTARAPKEGTAVRVAVCAQNKFWSILENRAAVSNVRLMRLKGGERKSVQIKVTGTLPKQTGARSTALALKTDWPDGTAFSISTTRGTMPPTVLLANGQAEIPLLYAEDDVGSALVTARVLNQEATAKVVDPLAGTLEIGSIRADGQETPALVQLIRDGKMIPGRYQVTMPGVFMKAPWKIDLSPGRWQLRVCRGPEFQALEKTLDVKSGEAIKLDRLELVRKVDLRPLGWYGGDADGDVYHGEQIYTDVTAGTAAEIAQAMGLDWVGCGSWRKPDPKTWCEARAVMRELSRPNFLFLWTDEKPKSREGHVCLVGIDRPDSDPFGWGWTGAKRPLRNFEMLQVIRASGAATFANHPLRWWTSGERFRTNMYASLPFDLCAAGLIDGYNVNEKVGDLKLWSMLLDHGYRVAATGGADFCLDRPSGPPPGKVRMYCYCPDGLSGAALAEAVRQGHTIVSTGPTLVADIENRPPGTMLKSGQTYSIRAKAWARGNEPDTLQRIELWSHGKAIATKSFDDNTEEADESFSWQPKGDWDWVAVRVISRRGWAITSAFYAAGPKWQPPKPIECRLTFDVTGLDSAERKKATVEVWDNVPSLVTSRKLTTQSLDASATLDVPVSATVVVRGPDGQQKEVSVYDAIGLPEQIERIASGAEREQPLLDWRTYEDVFRRCKSARVTVKF